MRMIWVDLFVQRSCTAIGTSLTMAVSRGGGTYVKASKEKIQQGYEDIEAEKKSQTSYSMRSFEVNILG